MGLYSLSLALEHKRFETTVVPESEIECPKGPFQSNKKFELQWLKSQ